MVKTISHYASILTTLLLILACATSTVTPQPVGFVETAIAGTYSVAASETAKVIQPEAVTVTGTRIASATPFPTFTQVVLGASQVVALVNTSCREGPGQVYEEVFILRRGSVAELVGRSADGAYFIIRNPNRPNIFCWLSSGTVRVNNLSGVAPIFTVPPTPRPTRTLTPTRRPANTATVTSPPSATATATFPTFTPTITETPTATETPVVAFSREFAGIDFCTTDTTWWANITVGNLGDVELESLSISMTDNDTSTTLSLDSDQFTDRNGCGPADSVDTLPVGVGRTVSGPTFGYDITGHIFSANITLCSLPGQTGTCLTRTITFTP